MLNVIYRIRNVVNGKIYIGSAENSKRRFERHRRHLRKGDHHCAHLQSSWNKHGEDCFKFEVIEQVEGNLLEAEQRHIDLYYGKGKCYNTAKFAGAPMRGRVHSDKTRKLLNEIAPKGEDHYRFGKDLAEETRKKIGDTQRGVPKGPGRKISEEGMVKIRASVAAGNYNNWEGRKHTKESKAKMSRAIVAVTPFGGIIEFSSITLLRAYLKLTSPTVDRALKSGRPLTKGKCANWAFHYKETYNYDIAFPDGRGPK